MNKTRTVAVEINILVSTIVSRLNLVLEFAWYPHFDPQLGQRMLHLVQLTVIAGTYCA